MSVQKEQHTIPAKVEERTVSVTCDLCGEVFQHAKDTFNGVEWPGDYGDIRATCVQIEEGFGLSDGGGSKTTRSYDVCMKCFKTKLEPWLQSQGAKPATDEFVW